MKKYQLYLLSILSGILFSISWPERGFPFLIFFAFIPLLFIENYISNNKDKFTKFSIFTYSAIAIFIWNVLTLYWIKNASIFGGAMAVLVNTLFMSCLITIFHISKRNIHGKNQGYLTFIFFWIAFEYLHLRWEINWPWLTTGNVFALYPKLIQWYEFTGVLGGSLWILSVNILIYNLLNNLILKEGRKKIIISAVSFLFFLFVPLIFSYSIYNNYVEEENPYTVVVVQPNIDPYNEKYGGMPYAVQIEKSLLLAEQKTDENTDIVVFPESAIQENNLWEREIEHSFSIDSLRKFINKHPNIEVVMGASTYKKIFKGENKTYEARQFGNTDLWYYAYNTAMYFDTSSTIQFYHKSKLVLGVERLPFPKTFSFLENFALDMGGTVGTLAINKERTPFVSKKHPIKIGTTICYESIYGEFCTGFVKKGANIFFIITNDGWWGNTPGYKQHFSFAPLRAIETRRSIARSANTGTSAFINQKGDVFQATKYWEEDVIKQDINANSKITFYVKYGDYVGRIALLGSVLLLLITISTGIIRKKKEIKN